MSDINRLMEKVDQLGILNIDVSGDGYLSPDVIETAIQATERLDARLDKALITQKSREADKIVAARYR